MEEGELLISITTNNNKDKEQAISKIALGVGFGGVKAKYGGEREGEKIVIGK